MSAELLEEAAREWLAMNTTLDLDAPLPAGARLFIAKYAEAMDVTEGVASESIAGMSQSFDTASRDGLLWRLARELLTPWMKSQVTFRAAKRRW